MKILSKKLSKYIISVILVLALLIGASSGILNNNQKDNNTFFPSLPTALASPPLPGGGVPMQVVGGFSHSLALLSNGTVWSWGYNGDGQLGVDIEDDYSNIPIKINISGVIAISAGTYHSLALKNDGTVWAWGSNGYGQLGDGTTATRHTPVKVNNLTDVIAINAGAYHSLALRSNGTVWAWGNNGNGQLGDNTTTQRTSPVQVKGLNNSGFLTGIATISTGNSHSLALKNDGTVWAWGWNINGQLGDGTTTQRTTPVQVSTLTSVTDISAGGGHNLAIKNDGTVWAWGANSSGQLGDNTTTQKTSPVQVKGLNNSGFLTDVTDISAGSHSLAVKSDGTAWAWGPNAYGQLGDSTTTQRNTPVQVNNLTDVTTISAFIEHSLAVKSDDTIWAWGYNGSGQLGIGNTTNSNTPKLVDSLAALMSSSPPVQIAAGVNHSLVLLDNGTVWAWGRNNSGQVGNGTTTNSASLARAGSLTDIIAISAGDSHSLALKSDGTVWAWGSNSSGQLGVNTYFTVINTPIQVSNLTGIIAISAGNNHSLALKSDGTVWAWGYNGYGQLGNSTTNSSSTPVQVKSSLLGISNLTGITAISAGASYSLALKNDGTVWSWGNNNYGQLGNGSNTQRNYAVQVSNLSGITAISAGGGHSLALKNDNTVWAWGYNGGGQLGNGSTSNSYTPVQVKGLNNSGFLTGITTISAGGSHSLALKSDGTVWAWGYNYYGQLGDGNGGDWSDYSYTPVQVKGLNGSGFLTGITAISAGNNHNLTLKSDSTAWAWGSNQYGQLGDGTSTDKSTPVQVNLIRYIRYLTFEQTSYQLASPQSGLTTTTVQAVGVDVDYQPLTGLNVTYSLSGTYTDVTINSSTGLITITSLAPAGTVNIVASYDGMTAKASLVLTTAGLTTAQRYGIQVASGYNHSMVLLKDGSVWTWGDNQYGQLGIGNTTSSNIAVQVTSLTNVIAIAAGQYHSLALKSDGTVWAWGYNQYGRLGDGTVTQRTSPVQVKGPNNSGFLTDVIAISAGENHSLALKNDGTAWSWGYNNYGQLGDGTTTQRTSPVQVKGLNNSGFLTDVTDISAGGSHSLALKNDNTVWAWGYNYSGQLGDGTTTQRTTPVQVKGLNNSGFLTDITAINAGGGHSLALKNDGTVWAWGANGYGQLGDGNYTQRTSPVQVKGLNGLGFLTDVTDISAGGIYSLALKSDGTVWAWGQNTNGQLGDGTTTTRYAPVQVKGPNNSGFLTDAVAISAGNIHSLALQSNGAAWAWGSNNVYQLGTMNTTNSNTPVRTVGLPKLLHLASINFNQPSYQLNIPKNGQDTIVTQAVGMDSEGNPVGQLNITYSLDNTYSGVSINPSTGLITVTRFASAGTVGIIASYDNLIATADLVLTSANAGSGVNANGLYTVNLYAQDISSFNNIVFTLTYDPLVLEVTDLCALTYQKETTTGPILGTDITILSFTSGTITFNIDKSIPQGLVFSGLLNALSFKALTDDTTTLTLSDSSNQNVNLSLTVMAV